MSTPVPGPKPKPVIGTAYSIDPKKLVQSDIELAKQYGEIFVQRFPGRAPVFFISSSRLVAELCDESRFDKQVHPAIANVRSFSGNGLFTADTSDPDWEKAHRILMPAFNPTALKAMYDGMTDIAEQLVLKWQRRRPEDAVEVTDEFTRLTLDTIALCALSYRFNSFYSEHLHPFVDAMVNGLEESSRRAHKPEAVLKLMRSSQKHLDKQVTVMHQICDDLIDQRRRNPSKPGEEDILDTMLTARDPETGERLSDENVRYQLVNFLVAGHETTSGLLSFALYELLRNREVFDKAREVIDEVLGDRFPTYSDLPKLSYIDQILRETLRLHPTAPAFGVSPYETTTIGDSEPGKGDGYEVNPGDTILVLAPMVHRDPTVWEDPERFDPERFSFENAKNIPPSAWKPFGNGQRSCIGRGFALQEALLVLTLVIQRFDPRFEDPNYELSIKETLTIKPENLMVKLYPREGKDPEAFGLRAAPEGNANATSEAAMAPGCPVAHQAERHGTKLQVFYGSDAGTCQAFAKDLGTQAEAAGFDATVAPLSDAVDSLRTDAPVLIVTSSYEGLPPKNAKRFLAWVQGKDAAGAATTGAAGTKAAAEGASASGDTNEATLPDLSGVRFAVFGCGNSEWASTFQRVPTQVDEALEACGAQRLIERGAGDVRADHQGSFLEWTEALWPVIGKAWGLELGSSPDGSSSVQVKVVDHGVVDLPEATTGGRFQGGVVERNDLLSDPEAAIPAKRHIEIRLPEGMTYETGDYLEILPRNPEESVERALKIIGLSYSTRVEISGSEAAYEGPVAIGDVLAAGVDLNAVVGRRALKQLAEAAQCPPERAALEHMATEEGFAEVVSKRISLLDAIEANASVRVDASTLLSLLPQMAPRRYSISSSELESPEVAYLTVSQVAGPAWSGRGQYRGAASSFLAKATPGTTVPVRVVPGTDEFRPPKDPAAPMVLVGAGSGMAPLRAFLADQRLRASRAGVKPGKSLLFYGCHHPDQDQLYRAELDEWAVDQRPAFSRHEASARYAQDRLWQDRADVLQMIRDGANVYVCGSAATLAPGVRETMRRILAEDLGSEDAGAQRLSAMESEEFTYITEAFT